MLKRLAVAVATLAIVSEGLGAWEPPGAPSSWPPQAHHSLSPMQPCPMPPPVPGTGASTQHQEAHARLHGVNETRGIARNRDRSLALAYLLWFFLGLLGVHQMYLGKVGRGIGYIFTGAWLTVGWWVDLITLPSQVQRINSSGRQWSR